MNLTPEEQSKIKKCDICGKYYSIKGKYSEKYASDIAFNLDPENNKGIKLEKLSSMLKYTISQINVVASNGHVIRTYIEECDICQQCRDEFHTFIKNRNH